MICFTEVKKWKKLSFAMLAGSEDECILNPNLSNL